MSQMIRDLVLFEMLPSFDGETFDHLQDGARLTGQLRDVYTLMQDGQFRTLRQIANAIGVNSEPGISARLRDLRKPRFGGHTVRRRRVKPGRGTYEYALEVKP